MARRIRNVASITAQVVVESPDEVAMVYEAPIVEFPGKKAHEVLPFVEELHDEIALEFRRFVNRTNDKVRCWVAKRKHDDWS